MIQKIVSPHFMLALKSASSSRKSPSFPSVSKSFVIKNNNFGKKEKNICHKQYAFKINDQKYGHCIIVYYIL